MQGNFRSVRLHRYFTIHALLNSTLKKTSETGRNVGSKKKKNIFNLGKNPQEQTTFNLQNMFNLAVKSKTRASD